MSNIINLLNEYERVILFDDFDQKINDLKEKLLKYSAGIVTAHNILFAGKKEMPFMQSIQYKHISETEYEDIIRLYRLYEFTDRLCIVSDSLQYGSMLNYLDTGVITEEELFDALLY